MTRTRRDNLAALLNLLVPGAGLILQGHVWAGLLTGLLFIVCANFALWAVLLIPDEISPWARGLGIGLAGGAYLGAQIRLAQSVRGRQRAEQEAVRRASLQAARQLVEGGKYAKALLVLAPVRRLADADLLVAYRLAQVYTGLQDADAALAAWYRVRRLDRHSLYREQIRAGLAALEGRGDDRTPSAGPAPGCA